MTHHHFKAPWGRPLLIVSMFVTLLMCGVAFMLLVGRPLPRFVSPPLQADDLGIVTAAVLLIPLAALPFIIRGYTLTKDGILIRRLWWNSVLPFADMLSVEVEPHALSHSFRTCGNGGLYSFTGFYWNRQLGHFRAYVTDLNRTVVVRMKHRTAVLSPDDPEAFVRTVSACLHS